MATAATAACFAFDGLKKPVVFSDCDDLPERIRALTRGWHVSAMSETDAEPALTVIRERGRYRLIAESTGVDESYRDTADIVCAFFAELIMAYGASRTDLLFLHAGAARIGGRLIAYPARGHAGKSTLTAQLAARGARIFSDDVLPMDQPTGQGSALGIAPRPRMPLPRSISAETRDWIQARRALCNQDFAYIDLPADAANHGGTLAPLGETAPIAAFVQIERHPDGDNSLVPTTRTDVMKLLIGQHFGARIPAQAIVERFRDLTEDIPCYRLHYRGGETAADMLMELADIL